VSNPISTVDSLQISAPISGANVSKAVISEKEVVNKSSHERDILSNGDEKAQAPAVANVASQDDLETLRLTEAAIKLQSACRGYQVILPGNFTFMLIGLICFCYSSLFKFCL
jgi:hypothetical protein